MSPINSMTGYVPIPNDASGIQSSLNDNPSRHATEGDDHEESSILRKCIKNRHEFVRQNTGLLLILGAQVFFSVMGTAVKRLHQIDPSLKTLQLISVRMAITFLCCITYMHITGVPDPILGPKGVRLLLVSRGFGGFIGLFALYYSLQYLSLSDATVLTFLVPTTTAIAGSLLLGEVFKLRQALAGMVSLAGVVLISRPTFIFGNDSRPGDEASPSERMMAVGVALFGVLGTTVAYTSIRAIGKRAHPMQSMVSFALACLAVSAIAAIVTRTEVVIPPRLDWLALLIMIGIFGFAAQTLLTMGLQRETMGRGTMAVYTQVVFAMTLEYMFFHTVPQLLSIVGTLMIILSAIYVAVTKETGQGATGKPISPPQSTDEDGLERGLLSQGVPRNYGGGATNK